MLSFLGVWALALLLPGQELPPLPPGPLPEGSTIQFELKFLEFSGLSWREDLLSKLRPIDHVDGTSIWLTDPIVGSELEIRAADGDRGKRLQGPRLLVIPGAQAVMRSFTTHNYIAQTEPLAVDTQGQARMIAFHPTIAQVRNGFEVCLSGEPVAGGLKIQAKLDECRLLGFDTVTVPVSKQDEVAGIQGIGQYQMPEVIRARAEGTWTVPTGQILVISLGFHHTHEAGESTRRERLLVIAPSCLSAPEVERAKQGPAVALPRPGPELSPEVALSLAPTAFPSLVLQMMLASRDAYGFGPATAGLPPIPTRDLPALVRPDGKPHETETDPTIERASVALPPSPHPSPQTRPAPRHESDRP